MEDKSGTVQWLHEWKLTLPVMSALLSNYVMRLIYYVEDETLTSSMS